MAAANASARERRQNIRQARVARGQALNAANQVGAGESSGLAGGLSGVSTQLDSNLAFSGEQQRSGDRIVKFGLQANKAQSRAGIASGIAGLGASAFSAAAPKSPLFS